MLAEDVAEAGTLACTECGQVDVLAPVVDDDAWVVLDSRSRIDRADQVLRLFAGGLRQTKHLVECPHALDDRPPQEDRERDGSVPQIVPRQPRGVRLPARRIVGASSEPVEGRICCEALCHAVEEVGRVFAVVVRKGNEVRLEPSEGCIPGPRQPPIRAQPLEPERWVGAQRRLEAVVIVLVDDQNAKLVVRLALE
jgi:hypothetical protein